MKITVEDNGKGKVDISGRVIDGHVDDQACTRCGEPRIYFDDFDSYFCPVCNQWLESACDDSACGYCKYRPEFPLENRKPVA